MDELTQRLRESDERDDHNQTRDAEPFIQAVIQSLRQLEVTWKVSEEERAWKNEMIEIYNEKMSKFSLRVFLVRERRCTQRPEDV